VRQLVLVDDDAETRRFGRDDMPIDDRNGGLDDVVGELGAGDMAVPIK
jgi:hypothetical protein